MVDHESFGQGSISKQLYDWITNNLEENSTILELGSGWATGQLAKNYNMISIEESKEWTDKHDSHYIHAPITKGWYDKNKIREGLEGKDYDLILVDGPEAHGTKIRQGFVWYNHLFKDDVIVIFDDVQRKNDMENLLNYTNLKNKNYEIFDCEDGKKFGVVYND